MEHRLEFTVSENPWAPTAVVAEINKRTGSGLELMGLAEQTGGVSSAAFVRWPDGRESAITRTHTPLERMRQTAEVLSVARSRGIPVPRHDLVLDLGDGIVTVVQERLPGEHADQVDAATVDAMVAMNERFADLLADRPDVPPPPAFPEHGRGNHPWEQTLGRYSDRTRRLLRRVREIDGGEHYQMTSDDLVHTDYSLSNVLFDQQRRVSGVVDWNFGAFRGDRRFALLGIGGYLARWGDEGEGQQQALDRLDKIVRTTIDPTLLRIYWAHRTVYGVHDSIQSNRRPARIKAEILQAEHHLA